MLLSPKPLTLISLSRDAAHFPDAMELPLMVFTRVDTETKTTMRIAERTGILHTYDVAKLLYSVATPAHPAASRHQAHAYRRQTKRTVLTSIH
jgi:hypothetical protein